MIIRCPNCSRSYQVPDPTDTRKTMKFRCTQCHTVFDATPQQTVSLQEMVKRVTPVATERVSPSVTPPRRPVPGGRARPRRRGFPWAVVGILVLLTAVCTGLYLGYVAVARKRAGRLLLNPEVKASFGGGEVFGEISGLAALPDGRIAVADRRESAIRLFSPDGRIVGQVSEAGSAAGQVMGPVALAYGDGKLATFDTGNGAVKVFPVGGGKPAVLPVYPMLFLPRDLALTGDGGVIVADTGHHRLLLFTPSGTVAAEIGRRGDKPGEFVDPASVVTARDGTIAVADIGNHRVSVFDPGGTLRKEWRYQGAGNVFSINVSLARLPKLGHLLVVDPHFHRIQVYSSEGAWIGEIGKRPDGKEIFEASPVLADSAKAGVLVVSTEDQKIHVLVY